MNMEPREILDEAVPKCFDQFCSKIRQKDSELPSIILQKASDVFNKMHGLKKIEKGHRTNIHLDIETSRQRCQANNHVKKIYKRVDDAAHLNLDLLMEIIEYYKNGR